METFLSGSCILNQQACFLASRIMHPRIVAIDFGKKRCGIAMTDPMGWFAQAVGTFSPQESLDWLSNLHQAESVKEILVGMPFLADGTVGETGAMVQDFVSQIEKALPNVPILLLNERYTSQQAMKALVATGVKKQKRKEKGILDKTAALLMLQSYLEENTF